MKPLENLAWSPACNWKWDPAAYHSKAVKESGWWKGKFALFLESGDGSGVALLSKGQLPPSTLTRQSVGKSFYRWREGAPCRNSSSSDSHPKIGHAVGWPASWLFLGTVNLHFQGRSVSISWDQFLDLWQLISWLQPGHHGVNFSHLLELSVSTRQFPACCSEYYLLPLRRN